MIKYYAYRYIEPSIENCVMVRHVRHGRVFSPAAHSPPVQQVAEEIIEIAGDVATLAAAIPGAKGMTLPGRSHMNAVGDRYYKQAVVQFLSV